MRTSVRGADVGGEDGDSALTLVTVMHAKSRTVRLRYNTRRVGTGAVGGWVPGWVSGSSEVELSYQRGGWAQHTEAANAAGGEGRAHGHLCISAPCRRLWRRLLAAAAHPAAATGMQRNCQSQLLDDQNQLLFNIPQSPAACKRAVYTTDLTGTFRNVP